MITVLRRAIVLLSALLVGRYLLKPTWVVELADGLHVFPRSWLWSPPSVEAGASVLGIEWVQSLFLAGAAGFVGFVSWRVLGLFRTSSGASQFGGATQRTRS